MLLGGLEAALQAGGGAGGQVRLAAVEGHGNPLVAAGAATGQEGAHQLLDAGTGGSANADVRRIRMNWTLWSQIPSVQLVAHHQAGHPLRHQGP